MSTARDARKKATGKGRSNQAKPSADHQAKPSADHQAADELDQAADELDQAADELDQNSDQIDDRDEPLPGSRYATAEAPQGPTSGPEAPDASHGRPTTKAAQTRRYAVRGAAAKGGTCPEHPGRALDPVDTHVGWCPACCAHYSVSPAS